MMNKGLPCYIISDLLPLYQDDILSEETKKDIDEHLNECKDCKRNMDAMTMQIDVETTYPEVKTEPLRKVRFYQKALTILGAVIAFLAGACYPIARLGFGVLERGEIAAYQIARLKRLWYILPLKSCFTGIIVCVIYLLIILLIRKKISKNAA